MADSFGSEIENENNEDPFEERLAACQSWEELFAQIEANECIQSFSRPDYIFTPNDVIGHINSEVVRKIKEGILN